MEVWFQRASDVMRKLRTGDVDVGIVGYDMFVEYGEVSLPPGAPARPGPRDFIYRPALVDFFPLPPRAAPLMVPRSFFSPPSA